MHPSFYGNYNYKTRWRILCTSSKNHIKVKMSQRYPLLMVNRDRLDQTAKTEVDRYSRYRTIKIPPKESRMRQS